MQALWRDFGRLQDTVAHRPLKPYTLADLRTALVAYAGDRAFADDFFRRYVEGHEVPDYERLLAPAGVLLRKAQAGRAWIGESAIGFEDSVAAVGSYPRTGSPLYRAGLTEGDRIVSLGGRPVASQADVAAVLAARRPGDAIPVEWEGRAGRRTATLQAVESPVLEVVTYEAAGRPVTAAMRAFRESWLGSKAGNRE